jgi:precorrin-6B methylase 2
MFWANIIGAAWQPTSKRRVRKMLEMAKVNSDDIVYDLGSGDGRIVTDVAKEYNARAVGIEADPLRVFWSRLTILFLGLRNRAKIVWGNFFNQNISEATVVTLFLSDKANQKLKSKFQEELKPGTRIVSYVWTFNEWKPVKSDNIEEIYVYIMGKSDSPYNEKKRNMGFYNY